MEADKRGLVIQPKYQSQSNLCRAPLTAYHPLHPPQPGPTVLLEAGHQELAVAAHSARTWGRGQPPGSSSSMLLGRLTCCD